MPSVDRHYKEINQNLVHWQNKPILKKIYNGFHRIIAVALSDRPKGAVVELGSGVPNIRETIPGCIRTDISQSPCIDQIENAYKLSFQDNSIAALILFDVFHHFRYPGTALKEIQRVLKPHGKIVIFDPCVSILGLLVYGVLHDEPLALKKTINWYAPTDWSPENIDYYAAQGNASRVFLNREDKTNAPLAGLNIVAIQRFSALTYILSGGYSKPQVYPDMAFPFLSWIEKVFDRLPKIFATRLLIVLEKR